MKPRISLFYLAGYLLIGGVALLIMPREAAILLQSNADYSPIMLRALGMFLVGIGIIVVQIIRLHLHVLYRTTLAVRAFFCVCLLLFYFTSGDPMFLVLLAIVFTGIILTGTSVLIESRRSA